MTTIAANLETLEMAADSQRDVNGSIVRIDFPKVTPDSTGCALIGTAGCTDEGVLFRRWYNADSPQGDKPKLGDDFAALVLLRGGIFHYTGNLLVPLLLEGPIATLGSGRDAAMGALYAGCSPAEAVEIAAMVDLYTGGPVVTEKL